MGLFNALINKIKAGRGQADTNLPIANAANFGINSNLQNSINNIQNTFNPYSNIDNYLNGANTKISGEVSSNNLLNPAQNQQSQITNAIQNYVGNNNTDNTDLSNQEVQNNSRFEAFKPQNIINKINNTKLNPNNWDEKDRAKALYWGNFLQGIASSPYNPQAGFMGSLGQGIARGSGMAQNQLYNLQGYKQAQNLYTQMGLDPNTLTMYGNYTNMTPEQVIALGIRNKATSIRQDIASARDNTTRLKMVMDGLKSGTIDTQEAVSLAKIYGLDISEFNESNQTKLTNSKIEVDKARIEKIKADIQQNAQRISILKQRVDQGAATVMEKAELNRLNIVNKNLLIEQNKLINQGMKEELSSVGSGGTTPRTVGQQKGGKVF